ncbi:metallophosphoesterase [Thalassobacillus hwangdonensis]|uniref:Metallophosphoesterase n=1 Tax=Thalassobacillus hwangdonensis TaxID=546108 RepID=A0ABW3KXA2_9BACI
MVYFYLFLLLVITGIGLLLYMYWKANTDHIGIVKIDHPKLPSSFEGFCIFLISDIHKRIIKSDTLERVKQTRKPDIILIAGDLLEKGVPLTSVTANIKRLNTLEAPIYFVWGNNDYEADRKELDALLLDLNVKVLANESVNFESEHGEKVSLMGLDAYDKEEEDRSAALKESFRYAYTDTEGEFIILAIHDPFWFDAIEQMDQAKISTVLSGHTHGGQIRIFGFGPYQRGGYSKKGTTDLFVSEGYGTTKLPLRLGTRAECHLVEFNKGKV